MANFVTFLPIETVLRFLQLLKAKPLIVSTLSLMINTLMLLPLKTSVTVFAFHVTVSNPVQPSKAPLPMLVTFVGMVIDFSFVSPLKALLPIVFKLACSVTDLILLFVPLKASCCISITAYVFPL